MNITEHSWSDWCEYIFYPMGDFIVSVFTNAWNCISATFSTVFDWLAGKFAWVAEYASSLFSNILPQWVLDALGTGGTAPESNGAAPMGGKSQSGEIAGNAAIKILVSGGAEAPKSVDVPMYGNLYRSGGG
jgi:hypothetical protein